MDETKFTLEIFYQKLHNSTSCETYISSTLIVLCDLEKFV